MRRPPTTLRRGQRLTGCLSVTLFLAATLLFANPGTADAQATFGCDPGFYQVIDGQLNAFDPATDLYEPIGAQNAKYNGIGYRVADGYMYGSQAGQLIRVDANGTVTPLGSSAISGYTGDFGDDGLLHLSRGGRDWVKINVDTLEITPVPALSGNYGVNDITNVNGKFYGVSSGGTLYIFDPIAETVTNGGQVTGLEATGAFGAAWSTAGGNLYVGQNSGPIYQIVGYSRGTPEAHRVATAQSTTSNDGGSCPYAAPPTGVRDVDGAEPETAPSTSEGAAAQAQWNQEYEAQQEAAYEFEDAGLGQGPSCDATVNEDRLPRTTVSANEYSSPTTIFSSSFDSGQDWLVLSGSWEQSGGDLRQVRDCGYDYTALLKTPQVENFRFEASVRGLAGINQGGLVFNQSSEITRSGAMVVDLANGGSVLRWGTYDNAGYYQFIGGTDVTSLGTDTIAVIQQSGQIDIEFNGQIVGSTTTSNPGGYVGLVSTLSAVAFEHATLTALPAT